MLRTALCFSLALAQPWTQPASAPAQDAPQDKVAEALRLVAEREGQTYAFRWDEAWPKLPEGMGLGNTHGCMVASRDGLIWANTDSENAVIAFDGDGHVAHRWGKDLAGGLHGMCLRVEEGREVLYLTHLSRHEVLKTTLDGEVLWTMGYPATSGHYESADQFLPTGITVGPDGDIYVADGYGRNWVHQFDAERRYIRSFGGPGEAPGQFRTCHGIWLDTRVDPPTLLVADRENHRLQVFDLEGNFVRVIEPGLRRPCSVYEHDGVLAVADLAGRVTLLDREDRLIAHLGDNPDPAKRAQNGVPREEWRAGEFLSPHSVCWDAAGNLYVMDWNALGRITKLERVR